MTTMTKEEMAKRIAELEKANAELKERSGQSVKNRIIELIYQGMNTIEDLSEACQITSKNVSSNLTRIRQEFETDGKTIVSLRRNDKTMLAVVELSQLGW
jgi:hypothetical protein